MFKRKITPDTSHEPDDEQSNKLYENMKALFERLNVLEELIVEGSHATKLDTIKNILKFLNIHRTETVWDIGVGVPKLAIYAGCLSNVVYATDICKYSKN